MGHSEIFMISDEAESDIFVKLNYTHTQTLPTPNTHHCSSVTHSQLRFISTIAVRLTRTLQLAVPYWRPNNRNTHTTKVVELAVHAFVYSRGWTWELCPDSSPVPTSVQWTGHRFRIVINIIERKINAVFAFLSTKASEEGMDSESRGHTTQLKVPLTLA